MGLIINPSRFETVGVGGSGYLDDTSLYPSVASTTCGQIIMGDSASWGSTTPTEVLNVITNPADGSFISEGHFYNGDGVTAGTEMSLTGTVGVNTSYATGDGINDLTQLKSYGANSVLDKWHRTDIGKGWFAIGVRYGSGAQATYWGNRPNLVTGMRLDVQSGDNLRLLHTNGGSNTSIATTTTLTNNQNYVIVVSWDCTISSPSTNVRWWVNADTATETDSASFAAGTSNASGSFRVPGAVNNTDDDRFYGWAWGNDFIGNTQAAEIRDWFVDNTPIT